MAGTFACRLSRPLLSKGGDFVFEPFGVRDGWIEVVGDPVTKVGVAFVCGIVDRFQQFDVAPRTAHIFGRAMSAGLDQARIKLTGLWIDETLDLDRVLPPVAEVVEIFKSLCADILENFVEPGLAGVEEVTCPTSIGVRCAPADVAGPDLVEMAVGPAHGGLDRQVQPVEPDIERNFDAAQNNRFDIVECDLEASDCVPRNSSLVQREQNMYIWSGIFWLNYLTA